MSLQSLVKILDNRQEYAVEGHAMWFEDDGSMTIHPVIHRITNTRSSTNMNVWTVQYAMQSVKTGEMRVGRLERFEGPQADTLSMAAAIHRWNEVSGALDC